jgi:hypothetical protein
MQYTGRVANEPGKKIEFQVKIDLRVERGRELENEKADDVEKYTQGYNERHDEQADRVGPPCRSAEHEPVLTSMCAIAAG